MAATRREFLKVAGGAAAAGAVGFPAVARAQARPGVPSDPVKIGILAIRAGIAAPVGTAGLRGTEWWTERVNKAGGILGRPVQLIVEEESNPKDTVERYRKLILQDKVEVVIGGISTGVTLALGPVAEEMEVPWLSWDGTTQKGVEETMPNPKWAFKSVDNEVEAIVAGQLTPKYFKGIQTIAGIGNDYSYGHDCWETYQAVLKKMGMNVKPVLELFPKLGVTDFTSHIAAIQQAKPDLLMCSFWSGDATIIMKQAAAVGLFKNMKGVFTTAGGVHDSLKKEFTPEGLLLGYNTMYFDDPTGSPLLKQFVREYKAKYNEYPPRNTTSTRPTNATTPTSTSSPTRSPSRRLLPWPSSGRPRRRWSRRSRASRPSRSRARARGGRTTSRCATSTRASPPTRTTTTSSPSTPSRSSPPRPR